MKIKPALVMALPKAITFKGLYVVTVVAVVAVVEFVVAGLLYSHLFGIRQPHAMFVHGGHFPCCVWFSEPSEEGRDFT
jgi:hypothetical protein